MPNHSPERVTIKAADGYPLAAALYEPAGNARAMVLLASAIGAEGALTNRQ